MIKSKIVGLVVPRVSVTNPTSAEAPHIPAWAAAVGPAGDKLFFRGTNGQPLRNATSKWGEMKLVPFSLMGLSWSIQKWTCAPKFLASLGKSTDGGHGTKSAISVRSLDPRLLTSPSNDRSTQTCCDCCGQNVNQTCGKNPIKKSHEFRHWWSKMGLGIPGSTGSSQMDTPWCFYAPLCPTAALRKPLSQASHVLKPTCQRDGDLKKIIEKQVGYAWSKKKSDKTWDWKGFLTWRQPQMHDNSCIFHHAWE